VSALRRPAPAIWLAAALALAVAVTAGAVRSGATLSSDWFPAAMALVAGGSCAWLAFHVELAWTFSAVIVLSVFSGQWSHLGLPIGADRLALAVALAVGASRAWRGALAPAAALAGHVRATRWLLVLVAAYAIVSAAWVGTLAQHDGLYGLLDKLGIVPFAFFAVAPVAFATERQRAVLLAALVTLGAYLGLTALAEGLGLDGLVFPRYIVDPTVGIHADRARGPFVEAVANGLALFACGVAAALALARWRDRAARLAACAVLVLCAVGIELTLTRAVWIAGIVAPAVAMLCSPALRRWMLPATAVAGLVVWGALAFVPGLQGKADTRAQDERSVWDRLNTDDAAVSMVAQRPLQGFGWNSFVTRGPAYLRQGGDYPLTGAGLVVHNVFLSNAAELGLVGLVAWLAAFLLGVGVTALRRAPPALEPWRIGLVALAVNYVVVACFGPLGYAFPTLLLWTWAGIVAQERS
jgi:putative inorganic carbon (hco3(-)) transporter